MANIKKIEDEELMQRLTKVFKDHGYEGASLTVMSAATGLKKPSLYHRFPDGKEQMAAEVLSFSYCWLEEHVFSVLRGKESPQKKIAQFVRQIDMLYDGGKESCLLNMLAPPHEETESFGKAIAATFSQLINALSSVAQESGMTKRQADNAAEQTLVEIHGALVVSRGIGSPATFKRMLKRLPKILTVLLDSNA